MKLERLFELQKMLSSYEKLDNRIELLKEEKELLSSFNKVAPSFNNLNFTKLDKFDGVGATLNLQKNITIKVFLCNVFMSNGIDTYEVAINKDDVLKTFEYQTKKQIDDILSYHLQYVKKGVNNE